MKFWFPITVFFNVYVIFLKFIFLASASGCCQVIVTWRNYQARYQPDILNPVNFFFFFFGEACQRLFTKLTDQCLDAPYLILQWNARKIKQWASAFCRICQGNLDHALGVQRRDRRQERIHWPRQTFSLTEASLFGSDVHSEDTWHIEKWAQERQRGIQSVLGTTVAFFTPRTSRVKGQGRQNLDGRGNVLTVATSLKLLRPQDVWLPEVITVRAVQGLHRDGGWLAKIHERDHCLGVRVAQHPAPVPGWSVIAQVVPGQTVGPVRHGQVMQAGLLLLRLGQGAEQGPHVPVQMMCTAQKKGVWGAVLVTSSPTSRPMLGVVASQPRSQKHSLRSSTKKDPVISMGTPKKLVLGFCLTGLTRSFSSELWTSSGSANLWAGGFSEIGSAWGRSVTSGALLGDLLLEFTYSFCLWQCLPFSTWIASAALCTEPRSTNAKHLQPFWTLWTWRGLRSFRNHRISSSEYLYVSIYSFSYSFPLWFIIGYWLLFPMLYSRVLLFIHSIYIGLAKKFIWVFL